jgi:hypothetical protein
VRARHRIEGLIALALAAAPPSAGHAAVARHARAPTASHCLSGETILYSGRYARALASVCLAGERVHYRYGPAGHPAIDLVSADDWSNVHYGRITGGGGGHQNHIRFTVGALNYVVFEGMYGDATDLPGYKWSGIYVGHDDLAGTTTGGRPRPLIADSWTDILADHAPLARRNDPSFEELRDGPWDAWF